MGFNLFKLDIFKDPDLPKPWFKTVQEVSGGGAKAIHRIYTFMRSRKAGYKFACDCRVKAGHYDYENELIWWNKLVMIYSTVIGGSTVTATAGGSTIIVNNVTGVWPVGITNDTMLLLLEE